MENILLLRDLILGGGIMKEKFIFILFMMFMFMGTSVHGATFKGRAIDADTREPIEGAVVVASWHEETATISGPSSRLKDVKETLTDKNGEWVIKGPRGREGGNITAIFTFLTGTYYTRPPEFIIFKPGYCSWPAGFLIDACKGKIKPEGNDKVAEGKTVELSKLINREDRLRALPEVIGDGIPFFKKQKAFMRFINEERRNIGLSENKMYKELLNEK